SPKLDPEFVQRERKAVNSEYQLKLKEDVRRNREVRRKTSNPEHPFYKFSVGNAETLSDETNPVWDDLKTFYDAEYSASRMALAIIGQQDLDTLQTMAKTMFSAVPTNGKGAQRAAVPIFTEAQKQVLISLQNLKNNRSLELQFAAPSKLDSFKLHTEHLLSGLLGHEGDGSLAALLKKKGWIESLMVGDSGAEDHTLYSMRMELTKAGFEHWESVVDYSYQYIRLVQQKEDLSLYFSENRVLDSLSFQYADPKPASSTVTEAARNLLLYPPQHVLDYRAAYTEYDPAVVVSHLNCLNLDNIRIFLRSPDYQGDKIESLYQTSYSIEKIDPELIQRWGNSPIDSQLSLPSANPYIPQNVKLQPNDASDSIPQKIVEKPGLVVWHHHDTTFALPKIRTEVEYRIPAFEASHEARIHQLLWVKMMRKRLEKDNYQQLLAGSRLGVGTTKTGIKLYVEGYNELQEKMLSELFRSLKVRDFSDNEFAIAKESLVRNYENRSKDRPFNQAYRMVGEIVDPQTIPTEEALRYLKAAQRSSTLDTVQQAYKTGALRMLIYGNATREEALSLAKLTEQESGLILAESSLQKPMLRKIDKPVSLSMSIEHNDSVFLAVYQASQASYGEQAKHLALNQLLKAAFFTELRTKQQLGYIVGAYYNRRFMLSSSIFGIQSTATDPDDIEKRINAFLVEQRTVLAELSEERFQNEMAGLVAKLSAKDTGFVARYGRWATNLALDVEQFDRKAQIIASLKQLDLASIMQFYDEEILKGTPLLIKSLGQAHKEAEQQGRSCTDRVCVEEALKQTIGASF
ncbi:MAG: insulinase family protein, partial [Myxococcota bacterium]|nr:insulinase family protein [Myxococcota bacterium]